MVKKKTILLLDDDHDFVEMNRRVLEAAGYSVICSYDTQDALGKLRAGGVDLVISDLMMKSIDAGFEFARQLKSDENLKHLPVIMATSVGGRLGVDFHPRSDADLAAMGIDAFFDKPIQPRHLLDKVAQLLEK